MATLVEKELHESLHEDDSRIEDLYRDTKFTDNVHDWKLLDWSKVVEAWKLEMMEFRKMGGVREGRPQGSHQVRS